MGGKMKNLLQYLRGYELQSFLAPLFKLLEAFFDLLVPLFVANIINRGIAGADMAYVFRQFGILIALALTGLCCSVTAQYFAAKASVGFASRLRQALFDHIQTLSFTELDGIGTDTLITRLTSDVNQVQNGLNMALRLLLRSPFIVFGAMVMAFTINVQAALIFAGVIPVLGLVVFAIMLVSIPLFRHVQKRLDGVLSAARENLTGVRVIRAFCREEESVREFDLRNEALTSLNEKAGLLSAFMNPLTYAIINIATVLLIRCGALQVSFGAIGQGDVVALYNYMAQIVVELIKLASLIITIDKSIACAGRASRILSVSSSMAFGCETETDPSRDAITFRDVSFTYAGASEPAAEHISFTLPAGSTLGIIGGTGSGKSTIGSLIARAYDAGEGEVCLFGKPVGSYTEETLHHLIGVVPQKAVLFSGTIRENMKLGRQNATDEEIMQALRTAQAEQIVREKEGCLDFRIEQNGRNLSGGQKQRLTIARALTAAPEILLMDDSASALDFATDAALRKAVADLDLTAVIISQRTSAVRHADLILVMEDGRLAGSGTHEELMRSCRVYQEIYYSQFPQEKPEHFGPEVAHA